MKNSDLDLKQKLKQLNQLYEQVSLEIRSGNLYVRGTFPGKSPDEGPKQRSVSLKLKAVKGNLKEAQRKALLIDAQLQEGKFNWLDHDPKLRKKQNTVLNQKIVSELYNSELSEAEKTVSYQLEAFETRYWATRRKTPTTEDGWNNNMKTMFDCLPPHEILTPELLIQTVLNKSQPRSRHRKHMTAAFGMLCAFSFPEFPRKEITKLAAGYKPKKKNPLHLPTDEQILSIYGRIENPKWKLAYGLMACYGIRPSELNCLDFSIFHKKPFILRITESGKTQSREIYPCKPAWPVEMRLLRQDLSVLDFDLPFNRKLCQRVNKAFYRNKIPHVPTALRDAYAIRLSLSKVPIEFAALWCGHSIIVHEQNYLDAINRSHNLAIFNQMVEFSDQ